MEILKYLNEIYSGENALKRHITLFSVMGLIVLMCNNVISSVGSNLYLNFITTAQLPTWELFINVLVASYLLLLIFGYEYKFINGVVTKNDAGLPELNLESYMVFFKMLPVFILWQFYYTVISVLGGYLLTLMNNTTYSYIFSAIMFCITPFVFMVFVKFAYNYSFDRDTGSPLAIFKYIDKSLMDVIIYSIQFCIIAAIPFFALIGFTDYAVSVKNQTAKMVLLLADLCIAGYIFIVLKLLYSVGIAKIVRKIFLKFDD